MVKNACIFLQKFTKKFGKIFGEEMFWSEVPKYRNTGIPEYRNTEIQKYPKKALKNRQNGKNGQKHMRFCCGIQGNLITTKYRRGAE